MGYTKQLLDLMRRAFKRKCNNAETLLAVRKKFPRSKITLYTINWHRNQFRKDDPTIPTEHSLR